jgi:hypothetical protein
MSFIEIVPVILINTDSKNPLKLLIHMLLQKPFINKFIDKETGSMAVVENQGMPERFGPSVKGVF